jgi:U4/U6.U5 tri-snRNP component SNU23
MSSKLNYKQVANVNRRTWDVETYEKRAHERQKALDQGETASATAAPAARPDDDKKEEFLPATKGAAGPEGSDRAFLQARQSRVTDLDARVGQTTMIAADAAAGAISKTDGVQQTGVGWHCKVCDCFLKDSLTYLDHINGRKHQRKLGYSMRAERSTTDDIKAKLEALKKKKETKAEEEEDIDLNERVQQKDNELQERQEERRRKRKERKLKTRQEAIAVTAPPAEESTDRSPVDEEAKEHEEEEPQLDPALVTMMGFSGFGGSTKN